MKLYEICLKSNGTGIAGDLFRFRAANYMVSPSNKPSINQQFYKEILWRFLHSVHEKK